MPHRQNTVARHVPPPRWNLGRRARPRAVRSTSGRTTCSPVPLRRLLRHRDRATATRCLRPASSRRCASASTRRAAASSSTSRHDRRALPASEESRGYDSAGELWSPGYFRVALGRGASATLVASTEAWERRHRAHAGRDRSQAERARRAPARRGHRARGSRGHRRRARARRRPVHDHAGRPRGRRRARARAGDELRTVIAGYHWFTDWGRDTMISLEGLTLVDRAATPRRGTSCARSPTTSATASSPTCFPRGRTEALYHTADATLWFFHALDRYLTHTGDRRHAPPAAARCSATIVAAPPRRHALRHRRRSRRRPAPPGRRTAIQLTWMDAKVGDWVVTPRRGKAVEINALWYNALRLLERLAARRRGRATRPRPSRDARRRRRRRRSTSASGTRPAATCYDVVDGERRRRRLLVPAQPALRHLAAAPGARRARWAAVLDVVEERLLTPVGLRIAGARPPRLQAEVLRRPARARRRLSPGHGLGLADRPVRRRLAAGPPRATAADARRFLDGLSGAPRRGVHRLDQRDLRRRAALHAARLHRPGLERRRGAAPPGPSAGLRLGSPFER